MEFMKYQNMRGGRVVFQDVTKPNNDEWGSALEAVQAAFDLEKKVNLVRKIIFLTICERVSYLKFVSVKNQSRFIFIWKR